MIDVRFVRGLLLLLAGLGMAGCGVPSQIPEIDRAGLTSERSWLPEGPPRAVVLALHGFNDYSRAFEEFGAVASAAGFAVHAFDQRGFGANADAGFWPGQAVLTSEVERRIAELRRHHPGTPLFLLGESMGAAVAIATLVREEPPDVDGVILSAPAVWGGDQMSDFYRASLWLAARVVPDLRLTGKGLERQASDNIEMLRALGSDPLVIKGTRVAAIGGLVELMDLAYGEAARLDAPLLILGGERDEIVPPQVFIALIERVAATPCTAIIYPEGWHLLLRDHQRALVYDDVLAWIDGASPPSGLARPCGAEITQDAAWQR